MKGYRCDTCHDFAQERVTEDGGIFRTKASEPPESWITIAQGKDCQPLHFCAPGCVAGWAQEEATLRADFRLKDYEGLTP